MINLSEAKFMLHSGATFGEVFSLIGSQHEDELRRYFTGREDLPNIKARTAKTPSSTGEMCRQCSSFNLVQTGPCKTCQDCGYNTGCS